MTILTILNNEAVESVNLIPPDLIRKGTRSSIVASSNSDGRPASSSPLIDRPAVSFLYTMLVNSCSGHMVGTWKEEEEEMKQASLSPCGDQQC